MPSLERARAKHNGLVAQLAKLSDKRERALAALIRADERRTALVRAIARSSKRLDKLVAAATHNGGPSSTVAPALVQAVAEKPAAAATLDDPVPDLAREFVRRGRAAQKAVDEILARPPADVMEMAEQGRKLDKARRRTRRTPDDFQADMRKRKPAPDRLG